MQKTESPSFPPRIGLRFVAQNVPRVVYCQHRIYAHKGTAVLANRLHMDHLVMVTELDEWKNCRKGSKIRWITDGKTVKPWFLWLISLEINPFTWPNDLTHPLDLDEGSGIFLVTLKKIGRDPTQALNTRPGFYQNSFLFDFVCAFFLWLFLNHSDIIVRTKVAPSKAKRAARCSRCRQRSRKSGWVCLNVDDTLKSHGRPGICWRSCFIFPLVNPPFGESTWQNLHFFMVPKTDIHVELGQSWGPLKCHGCLVVFHKGPKLKPGAIQWLGISYGETFVSCRSYTKAQWVSWD